MLLISQCDKRALTETRRILDQFAERRGDRTWQTPITRDGLDTLRRLLRKTARKNTAVACHWIRGLDHTELLWIVGDAGRFNAQGAVPTNTTTRDVLRRHDENDWHTGEDIHLLTVLAALLHDLGKASEAFQWRLSGKLRKPNEYRHEWVSLRLFEAFVGADDDAAWLSRLAAPAPADDACWLDAGRLRRDGLDANVPQPFRALGHAPLAQAVGWLIVTHHRLPVLPGTGVPPTALLHDTLARIDAHWNNHPSGSAERQEIEAYWRFPHGLPVTGDLWRKRAARVAQRLLTLRAKPGAGGWLDNPYVMHVSRLCLMAADHHYSSLTEQGDPGRAEVPQSSPLYANTHGGPGAYNQTLDEHLIGVTLHAGEVTRALPRFEQHLPRLKGHRALRKRSRDERFRWQDKAADLASAMSERAASQGAFIVNMASTGSGKTLANARVMYALSGPERGMRCAFAMGLRTLTLQTGQAFRNLLGLRDDELAIRTGGSAVRALFEHYEEQAEASGSASRQALFDEGGHVIYEGNVEDHPLLRRVTSDPPVRALLAAPVLVCTIDHLTPATESLRGGRQIAPMLRLMSGDLVLDEPDDFDIGDLPALTRLVHWAGLLGSRVLLSSATLPPALVQGLFRAYRDGRRHFERNRGEQPGATDRPPSVCCAWIDEFNQSQRDCDDADRFAQEHQTFAARRHERLGQAEVRRRCQLLPLALTGASPEQRITRFAQAVLDAALDLHRRHHSPDPRSSKRASFGLVRMANIDPLVDVALALYKLGVPSGARIHLCVYHSQFPLVLRSEIERRLDAALNRREPDAVFDLPDIRRQLDAHDEPDRLFIVLGSPVTEVGRDHDYDWAVVEPSSMRSLIQLAGRVRRHRPGACTSPNIAVFETNLRHFAERGGPAFCRPGFETINFPLDSHQLSALLSPAQQEVIDARPRIVEAEPLLPRARLVDLEHARLRQEMLPQAAAPATPARRGSRPRGSDLACTPQLNAASWWSLPPADASLTGTLPHRQRFRRNDIEEVELLLRPNEATDDYELVEVRNDLKNQRGESTYAPAERHQNHRLADRDVQGIRIQPWGRLKYLPALTELAAERGLDLDKCALRFGTLTVPKNESGWRSHATLGFSKARVI